MTVEQLLAWGEHFHYPQLVLNAQERDVVRHGEIAWKRLTRDTQERMNRAVARIETWQMRTQEHVGEGIA